MSRSGAAKERMNGNENSESGFGLSFTRLMPLNWQHPEKDAAVFAVELEQLRNERLLRLLLFYDDYPIERRNQTGEHEGEKLNFRIYRREAARSRMEKVDDRDC